MPSSLLAEPGNLEKIANDKNLEQHQRELGNKIVSDELHTKHNIKNIKNYRIVLKIF